MLSALVKSCLSSCLGSELLALRLFICAPLPVLYGVNFPFYASKVALAIFPNFFDVSIFAHAISLTNSLHVNRTQAPLIQ